jgi:GMP synthase-like glutamine amidotransferase
VKVLILQHGAHVDAGSILNWCAKRNAEISFIKLYESNPQFDLTEKFDLMVILGGIMSVNDENEFAWLSSEKIFIRQMIESNIPILGICLGAQLIATALGVTVSANPESEIGWHSVRKTSNVKNVFQFPEALEVFHWHNETFQLPPNAIRFAESDACNNQGFQIGDRVIGLQFHPEVTLETIGLWIEDEGSSLQPSQFVQTSEKMKLLAEDLLPAGQKLLDLILDYLVKVKS